MKKAIILSALLLAQTGFIAQAKGDKKTAVKKPAATAAATAPVKWSTDATHSAVKFSVTHLTVSTVEGNFKKFEGTVVSSGNDFNNAQVNFIVDVSSINTDNEARDKHLKSDDFFNAEKYPNMTFTSTSFKKIRGNMYALEGNLTIRDVTKKVKFGVLYGGTVKDPWGNIKAGFKATSTISRKAYNLKWNALTEAGGAVVGDEVTINLNMEFAQQKS
ncbi:MAG: YceI family protein [Flavipsychrobacter sp.]